MKTLPSFTALGLFTLSLQAQKCSQVDFDAIYAHIEQQSKFSFLSQNHIGGFFGNHNGRGVGVTADDFRHNGSINNP